MVDQNALDVFFDLIIRERLEWLCSNEAFRGRRHVLKNPVRLVLNFKPVKAPEQKRPGQQHHQIMSKHVVPTAPKGISDPSSILDRRRGTNRVREDPSQILTPSRARLKRRLPISRPTCYIQFYH
jgi:hypothetical protein